MTTIVVKTNHMTTKVVKMNPMTTKVVKTNPMFIITPDPNLCFHAPLSCTYMAPNSYPPVLWF